MRHGDHEEILNTGDAYYMAPGHTTVTDAGTEWLEFSKSRELQKTNEGVERNLAKMNRAQRPRRQRCEVL